MLSAFNFQPGFANPCGRTTIQGAAWPCQVLSSHQEGVGTDGQRRGHTETETSRRPHASSSANSEIPIHPWAEDQDRQTAEGTLFVPPLQMR